MPSYPLNNIVAPDNYTNASTLFPLPVIDHVNLDVTNGAIYWSIAQANRLSTDRSGAWQPEVFMLPGSRTIDRQGIVGVRVRAAVAAANLPAGASPARVTVEAVES